MTRHILINDEGNPIAASQQAIMERAIQAFGGISWETLIRTDEAARKAAGIHIDCQTIFPSLLAYQKASAKTPNYDGTNAWYSQSAIDMDIAHAQSQALEYISSKRWEVENKGTPFGAAVLDTSRENRANYVYNRAIATADSNHVITNWKIGEGLFMNLDAPTIIAASDAVAAHVQASYNREAELSVFIQAAVTLDDLRAIDLDSGWPANEPPEA